MFPFGDKKGLKQLIDSKICKLDLLSRKGEHEECRQLAKNVSYLSAKLATTDGFVVDPDTGSKFFLSPGHLNGGVVSYASGCSKHNVSKLYGSRQEVEQELDYLLQERESIGHAFVSGITALFTLYMNFPASTGVIIENASNYHLEFVSCGNGEGYFFSGDGQAAASFQGPGQTIEPQKCAGFLHTKTSQSAYGAVGYITFRIRTSVDERLVIVAWGVYRGQSNYVGLEVRVRDTSNGTLCDPDVQDLASFLQIKHTSGDKNHLHELEMKDEFKLLYSFTNSCIASPGFELTVQDA